MAVTVTNVIFSQGKCYKNSHFADRKTRGSCSGPDLDGYLQEVAMYMVWEEWGCPQTRFSELGLKPSRNMD